MGWRYALATSVGSGHAEAGLPCQDRAGARLVRDRWGEPVFVAAVADGAGSAARAEAGAERATSTFMERACATLRTRSARALAPDDAAAWAADARAAVEALAADAGREASAFACTLLGAVIARRAAALVQIGDGAIVTREAGGADWSFAFWPQNGEFANTTRFLTDDDALSRVQVRVGEGRVDEVALFSDGLQTLALDLEARSVHAPFVEGMLRPLRTARARGECGRLSEQLGRFLDSPRVLERTDDDKSLILATRRAPPKPTAAPATPPAEATVESGDP